MQPMFQASSKPGISAVNDSPQAFFSGRSNMPITWRTRKLSRIGVLTETVQRGIVGSFGIANGSHRKDAAGQTFRTEALEQFALLFLVGALHHELITGRV